MSAPAVLLDACTLVPIRLASCLLALAEAGLLVPLWSDEILDEVERSLPKLKKVTSSAGLYGVLGRSFWRFQFPEPTGPIFRVMSTSKTPQTS